MRLTPAIRKRIYETAGALLAVAASWKLISEGDVSAWQEGIGVLLSLLARFNVQD